MDSSPPPNGDRPPAADAGCGVRWTRRRCAQVTGVAGSWEEALNRLKQLAEYEEQRKRDGHIR